MVDQPCRVTWVLTQLHRSPSALHTWRTCEKYETLLGRGGLYLARKRASIYMCSVKICYSHLWIWQGNPLPWMWLKDCCVNTNWPLTQHRLPNSVHNGNIWTLMNHCEFPIVSFQPRKTSAPSFSQRRQLRKCQTNPLSWIPDFLQKIKKSCLMAFIMAEIYIRHNNNKWDYL